MDDHWIKRRFPDAYIVPVTTGWFDDRKYRIPPDFFKHVLCYVLQDCAFGLVWAQRFGAKEIAVQNALVEQIMGDFDGLKATQPKWWE